VTRFADALQHVLGVEGGWSDVPQDRGGKTNFGVTHATYDSWRKSKGLPRRSVKLITLDEVRSIYHERYWQAAKCDALPWPASLCHFDAAVNHGVGNAAKLLQQAVGAQKDGVIGPQTMGAIQRTPLPRLLSRLWVDRLDYYSRIVAARPDQKIFAKGWDNRIAHLMERCLTDFGRVA
jgi:lysozyme family protein